MEDNQETQAGFQIINDSNGEILTWSSTRTGYIGNARMDVIAKMFHRMLQELQLKQLDFNNTPLLVSYKKTL